MPGTKPVLRKLLRAIGHAGQQTDIWPVLLLLFAVLVPAVCLLWFMAAAMRNERFAVRQRLAEVYRSELVSAQARLERSWDQTTAELEKCAQLSSASAAFACCLQSSNVDSVILLRQPTEVIYPNAPSRFENGELESDWTKASQLEYFRNDLAGAAKLYDALARRSTNVHLAARAFQAEARCLVRAGQPAAAVRLINDSLGVDRFRQATDPQGRLLVANAELLALELLSNESIKLPAPGPEPVEGTRPELVEGLTTNRAAPEFQVIAEKLRQRLLDYEHPVLAAAQRRFLMKELQKLSPAIKFPTLAAEELAAQFAESRPPLGGDPALQRTSLPEVWQFSTPDRKVTALIRTQRLLGSLREGAMPEHLPAGVEISLGSPETDSASAFVTVPAGKRWPGWHLALSFKDQRLFDATTEHRTTIYLWTAILVLAAMGVLTLLAVAVLRRQAALARLKNALAATVSHELKTPLSSMRVLVDTLLNSRKLEEQTVREYLQLIAQENERLSRLIQNFLAFSRMERQKYTFNFEPWSARVLAEAAAEAVRERFEMPGCRFEVQNEGEGELPPVLADRDAMVTALINLLDNAYKYSADIKHIVLRLRARNGRVHFSVQDNGIGITPRERKRIFQPFYQVDERLSRERNGCGLGLSIVQFIVGAHHGEVSVESQPGTGSTFTIALPAASPPAGIREEAIG